LFGFVCLFGVCFVCLGLFAQALFLVLVFRKGKQKLETGKKAPFGHVNESNSGKILILIPLKLVIILYFFTIFFF